MTSNTKIYIKFLMFLWLVAIILRFSFLLWQWQSFEGFSSQDILKALYIGVRFDGRIAAFMSLPLLICLFLSGRFFNAVRVYLLVFYGIVFTLYVLLYIADFAHYAYLQSRLNFSTLALLEDTKEALGMVWQTYPVIKLVFALILIVSLLIFFSKKILDKWVHIKTSLSSKITSGIAILLIIFVLIYGQYSIVYYPLRWSEAYFSGHNQITALALNPLQNLIDTRPTKDTFIDNTPQARLAYPTAAQYLNLQHLDEKNLHYDRFTHPSSPAALKEKPNIVIIVIESMSTHKSSLMFDELDTTPFLQSLAQSSLYFPNYYASARTTARAMFSIITGIPDVNEFFKTSSRDPNTIDQHLVWNDFEGYSKLYMLGGNANWANIRGVMSNNIAGLQIYEEGYWQSPRLDVWGISDKDLLQEANALLQTQQTPFISLIQLASFHTPFSVPSDMTDFDYTLPSDDFLKKYGFGSAQEYLSMKFCDYALQKFFEVAKQSNYYENTIFIITGDHGMSETSLAAPSNYQYIRLHEFQVPLIIHYPKAFPQGKVMPQAGGHIDIFPTAAGLAGVSVQNTTMGRDLLDNTFGDERFTFIRRLNRPPILVSSKYCYSNEYPESGGGMLYTRPSDDIKQDWLPLKEQNSPLAAKLHKISEDMEQTATYMLYHNSKQKAKEAKEDLYEGLHNVINKQE
ncbi:LTA synthase family protein [Helicobacter marmotae]|nr:alkaline phosphatase family protein [Helicobacter marmotae]